MPMMPKTCTAFAGFKRIASGPTGQTALAVKAALERGEASTILVFDDDTGAAVDFDLRGSPRDILARLGISDSLEDPEDQPPRGPGRPRLGVVSREVTLLPRHWEWLNTQPGGASVALRKLVEAARKTLAESDRVRLAREAAYRFMSAMAGNEPGFEEAVRALYAPDMPRFDEVTTSWPAEVRDHAKRLAAGQTGDGKQDPGSAI
jgi:hypothetical protein